MKVITLPNGHSVTIAAYVMAWKQLLTKPDGSCVGRRVYNGWTWYPVTAGEILSQMSRGVHDRINRHLPDYHREPHTRHAETKLSKLVRIGLLKCECRWCGSPLSTYQRHQNRFCEASCRRSYHT